LKLDQIGTMDTDVVLFTGILQMSIQPIEIVDHAFLAGALSIIKHATSWSSPSLRDFGNGFI